MGEQWCGLGPMSIPSALGHLAMPINFLAQGKNQVGTSELEPGTSRFRILSLTTLRHTLCHIGYKILLDVAAGRVHREHSQCDPRAQKLRPSPAP